MREDVLDLGEVDATLGRVHDLRRREAADTNQPPAPEPSGRLVSLALVIAGVLHMIVSLLLMLVALPFELIFRLVGLRGLGFAVVLPLISIISAPISIPMRRRAKARRVCPLCRQPGTVERVVDVTVNGNARFSVAGVERSVADPGVLKVEEGERLTISRCEACLEHFIEGPNPD
jgi:hypothetical protein